MVDITLFEINLPEGTSFNASNKAPLFGGRKGSEQSGDSESPSLEIGSITGKSDSDAEAESDDDSEFDSDADAGFDADESESGGGKALPLLGLLALAVLAVAVRTLMGGSDQDVEELDELDDLSEMDVESGR